MIPRPRPSLFPSQQTFLLSFAYSWIKTLITCTPLPSICTPYHQKNGTDEEYSDGLKTSVYESTMQSDLTFCFLRLFL